MPDSQFGFESCDVLLKRRISELRFLEEAFEFQGRQLSIDTSSVLDRLGANPETEGRKCLSFIIRSGRTVDDESGS